ncbi:MAG: DUF2442 domain-containing protein [Treponemataceae bacterium]
MADWRLASGGETPFSIEPYLEIGRFKELRSETMFQSARVSFDTVEWANGLDIDPEELYENSRPVADEAAEGKVFYKAR